MVQGLPREFCQDALPISSTDVTLVDELGFVWALYLNNEYGLAQYESVLMRGWGSFRDFKGFRAGQKLRFGVLHANAEVLYYLGRV